MISKTLVVKTFESLKNLVNTSEIDELAINASSVLVQVFTSLTDPLWAIKIETVLREKFPDAMIVGTSSGGEIAHGQLFVHSTIVSITFFKEAKVKAFVIDASNGNEADLGKDLRCNIEHICTKIAGVLLLGTPLTMDVTKFLIGLSGLKDTYPIFGGGAGDYGAITKSLIFSNGKYLSKGAVAVVFMGDHIQIESYTYLGWKPISKEMVITEVDGLWVKKIDDKPTFHIYQQYLDIQNDDDFFLNVLEFPLMVKRDGVQYARVPKIANEDNALMFSADLKEGERVSIGYGNPNIIIDQATEVQSLMATFEPESIFLYSCICRRFLLQNDVDQETKPFETIAPTSGFYTYGEFEGTPSKIHMLNATMVAVGMKECNINKEYNQKLNILQVPQILEEVDPLAYKHSRIISRLIYFIRAVTDELEEANKKATRLSEIDYLTQTFNRIKANEIFERETKWSQRFGVEFSIILLDVDYFKEINDTYGHNIGDEFLVELVEIIKMQLRTTDMLIRWGGEEFIIAMPETGLAGAKVVAEKVRREIEQTLFPIVGQQTCSFGVCSYKKGEQIKEIIERADQALYEAKRSGRNKIVLK